MTPGGREELAALLDLRDFLDATTVPEQLADLLVAGAPPLWLSSDRLDALATDLVLCHPPLAEHEVRARVAGDERGPWRLTVVARDRRGLLADTAAALSAEGLSIRTASVATWTELDLALHAVTAEGSVPPAAVLDRVGARLRAAANAPVDDQPFVPIGSATVRRAGVVDSDTVISVTASDQPGLLASVCRWFADHGASIQAARVATGAHIVHDVFIVRGSVDTRALERYLSAPPERRPRVAMLLRR